jgi:hypothetical protein
LIKFWAIENLPQALDFSTFNISFWLHIYSQQKKEKVLDISEIKSAKNHVLF